MESIKYTLTDIRYYTIFAKNKSIDDEKYKLLMLKLRKQLKKLL